MKRGHGPPGAALWPVSQLSPLAVISNDFSSVAPSALAAAFRADRASWASTGAAATSGSSVMTTASVARMPIPFMSCRRPSFRAEDHEAIVARLRRPDLARPPQHLPDVRATLVARKHAERLRRRLEPDDRVGAEIAEPDDVALVDVDGVGPWAVAGQPPRLPRLGLGVVDADVTGVPFADPDATGRVRPHAARALILGGRLDDRGRAGVEIDARDVIAGERGVVHVATRRRRDAIRPAAARGIPHVHLAGGGIEPPVDTALAGEPDPTALVEGGGVEVGPPARLGQRPALDLARLWVDPHDRVRSALGHPWRAVGADDHPVRRGSFAQRHQFDLAALGFE